MLLSPAKRLDFDVPLRSSIQTQPVFPEQTRLLVDRLRALSPAELASLMGISDPLALLNFHRYADWDSSELAATVRQAVLAFDGDAYQGLQARTMSDADLAFAQKNLRILSGLYGLLRPLDLIRPHRLEMGTKLANPCGKDLYAFWNDRLVEAVNSELEEMPRPIVLNLASQEYFKVLLSSPLRGKVVTPVFQERKDGRFRVVSLYAKRARGLMARYAILHRMDEPEDLLGFDAEGYAFSPEASDELTWVFRR